MILTGSLRNPGLSTAGQRVNNLVGAATGEVASSSTCPHLSLDESGTVASPKPQPIGFAVRAVTQANGYKKNSCRSAALHA